MAIKKPNFRFERTSKSGWRGLFARSSLSFSRPQAASREPTMTRRACGERMGNGTGGERPPEQLLRLRSLLQDACGGRTRVWNKRACGPQFSRFVLNIRALCAMSRRVGMRGTTFVLRKPCQIRCISTPDILDRKGLHQIPKMV